MRASNAVSTPLYPIIIIKYNTNTISKFRFIGCERNLVIMCSPIGKLGCRLVISHTTISRCTCYILVFMPSICYISKVWWIVSVVNTYRYLFNMWHIVHNHVKSMIPITVEYLTHRTYTDSSWILFIPTILIYLIIKCFICITRIICITITSNTISSTIRFIM